MASQVAPVAQDLPANTGDTRDMSLIPGSGQHPEEGMTAHSSNFASSVPWTEEPDRLQSIGLQRVGNNWNNSARM